MYLRICTYVYIHMHICTYVYIHMHVHYVRTYVYMYTFKRMYMCTGCISIYIRGVYRYIYGEYICIGVLAAGSLGFRV
jgi:hypothetical protein